MWSSYGEGVPEERRPAMMELLTRINPDVAVGAFELDLDRGNVSFRTSIDVTGDRLTDALLERLIGANVGAFDDYLPAIEKIALSDGHDPKAVLQFLPSLATSPNSKSSAYAHRTVYLCMDLGSGARCRL